MPRQASVEGGYFAAEHEPLLSDMYLANDYPSDRYQVNRSARRLFVQILNASAGTDYAEEVVMKRLIQMRKAKRLARLGKDWKGPVFTRKDI